MRHGQLLVELAVLMPLMLFLILGGIEAGMLLIAKATQDRATSTVATWAAQHPGQSWAAVAVHELAGCSVTLSYPLPGLVEASSRCLYVPIATHGLWDGLPISSTESAGAAS